MKRMLLTVATLALAGCAAQDVSTSNEVAVEKQYRTGSNLPVKRSPVGDGVRTISKEDLERTLDSRVMVPMPNPTKSGP
jgi:type IV pilus biogenesis protein CpaD/CtpE